MNEAERALLLAGARWLGGQQLVTFEDAGRWQVTRPSNTLPSDPARALDLLRAPTAVLWGHNILAAIFRHRSMKRAAGIAAPNQNQGAKT